MTMRSIVKRLGWAFLAAALSAPAFGESFSVPGFGGLNDTGNTVAIGDLESPDTLNVMPTEDGLGIRSRPGFSLDATLTVATSPVVGSYAFRTTGGNSIRIFAHDVYVSASSNKGAFSNIITTATSGISRWSFSDANGSVWGASDKGTEIWSYNGSAVTWYPALPKGTVLTFTPDRLVIAGVTGYTNRVYYSASGDFDDFTAGTEKASPWTDDIGAFGDKVTALRYSLGRVLIWSSNAMTACEGSNQFDLYCYDVSKTAGTSDPQSVIDHNGMVYWRGTDKHFYSYDGSTVVRLTDNQAAFIGAIVLASQRSDTVTDPADFNEGTQTPAETWDSTSTVGSLQPATWTVTATAAADFGSGTFVNFSSSVVAGEIRFQYLADDFTDGVYTATPTWTESSSGICSLSVVSGQFRVVPAAPVEITQDCVVKSTSTAAYGTWSWDYLENGQDDAVQRVAFVYYAPSKAADLYAIEYDHSDTDFTIKLGTAASISHSSFYVLSSSAIGVPTQSTHSYVVNRTEAGEFTVWRDGVSIATATSTAYKTSSEFVLYSRRTGSSPYYSAASSTTIDNIVTPATGSYQSAEYNTTFSTPVWGSLGISSTIAGSGALTLETKVSSASGGTKDAAVSVTDGTQIGSAAKPYITFIASASASSADEPVIISSYTLRAATTGQFDSACITGNTVSSFGTLSCSVHTTGGGAATFYGRSAATCATLTGAWSATTNNSAFAPSANEAFQWRLVSTLTHATDTVRLDSCVLNWNEAAPSASFGAWHDDGLYWGVTYSSGTTNNRVLYHDLKQGGFFPWDIPMSAPVEVDGTMYFGSSRSGYVYRFDGVDNDTGTAISSYWTSKDYPLGDIGREKAIDRYTVVMKAQGAGSLSLDYTYNNATATTKSLSMVSTAPVVVYNFNAAAGTQGYTTRFKLYNSTINVGWEVYGLSLSYHFLPWRVP